MYPIKEREREREERKRNLSAYPPLENNGERLKKWAFN